MPRRSVALLALAALAACAEAPPTAPALDELPIAAAPNNGQQVSVPRAAAFALLDAERVQVCLALPLDSPGNGDFAAYRFDEDSGFYLIDRQSSTSRAVITVYATVADYVNGNPYLEAEGHAVEKISPGNKSALVFHAQGQSDDGTNVTCTVVFPSKRLAPGGEAVRRISVR